MRLGVKCVRGNMTDEECDKCQLDPLHPCGLPPELINLVRHHDDNEPNNLVFSPSRLMGCNRKAVLINQTDYYLNVEHQYAALRGTLIHSGIETLGRHPVDVVKEERITTMIDTCYGPQPFTAKADCIVFLYEHGDFDAEGKYRGDYDRIVHVKVRDYKTTGEIGHDKTSADREHQMQVNMYAYVVTKEASQYFGGKVKVIVDELEINYLGSNKPRRFTSAGSLTAVGKKPRGAEEAEVLTLEPITLLPMERVEKFIRARIEKRIREREAGLPPILPPGEDKWCFRCVVRHACLAAQDASEDAA